MRRWSLLILLLILMGCAPKGESVRSNPVSDEAPPVAVQPPGEGQPVAASPVTAQPSGPVQVEIPGGFRIGSLHDASGLRWLDADRVAVLHKQGNIWVTKAVSTDRRHLAYLHATGGSTYQLVLLNLAQLAPASPVDLAPGVRLLIWLEESGPEGGGLLITDTVGRELLSRFSGALEVTGLREAGAPYPILLLMVAGGGSMGMHYEAYLYEPGTATLQRIPWGENDFVVSRSGVEQVEGGVETTHREPDGQGWKERTVIWRYRDGAMQPVTP